MFPAAIGLLALAGRTLGLGFERPMVKSLSRGRDSIAATTLYFGIGELLLIPLWAWQWLHDPAYVSHISAWIIPALVTAVIYAISFHTYVYAMGVGEVSYLTPLYATAFIWLYVLDIIFGKAQLGWLPACGVGAVTLGLAFLNAAPGRAWSETLSLSRLWRQPGVWGMLVYAFGLATARLIDKSVADTAPPLLYAFINNSLSVLGGLALLAWRGRAGSVIALYRERPLIATAGAVAGMGAYVLLLVALDYFNPSVVEPVTQLSVFIAIALGGLWFGEPVRTRWAPSALMVLGAVLLMLGR
jgi:drug/metabolite transporter (DMT)-like permease